MQNIELGKIVSENQKTGETLSFEIVPYNTRGILINGITGSRKTTLILEMLRRFDKISPRPQQVIISREGEEQKLRKDYPLIIIGNRGEIPMDINLASQLGRKVRMSKLDFIVNIVSLKTEKEQDEFLSAFLDGMMMDDEQEYWNNTCVIVIDEIQEYAPNYKATKSRDAIKRITTLGKKRGLILLAASHSVKDFHYSARKEIDNRIVGYLREENDRKAACELLTLEESKRDIFLELDGSGRFMVWGSSICKQPKIFELESDAVEQEERFVVPELPLSYKKKADQIMKSLDIKNDIPVETRLRIENEHLRIENLELKENQLTPEHEDRIYEKGKQFGIMIGNERNLETIKKLVQCYEAKPISKIFKREVKIIKVSESENGITDIRLEDG